MVHPYIPNDTEVIRQRILDIIGIDDIEELFSDIPGDAVFTDSSILPEPHSEIEVLRHVKKILSKNITSEENVSFLGGGVWCHYVPSVVDTISARSEFLTSYTPYQPEINQGLLQALFEYQSLICELVDMDVANSSLYDWATSLSEAAKMASRVTKRTDFLVPNFIHPERLMTLRSYVEPLGMNVTKIDQSIDTGQIDLEDLKTKISKNTSGIYVENPCYLGHLNDSMEEISEISHDTDALFIVGVDPISLGVIKPPGAFDADIVIGEGQPLGNYVNFGGSLLGIFACKDETRLIRQLPGRLVGMTTDVNDKRGFCLVLQTREQHIRREKATSNICTNQAHVALRAAVYLSLLGKDGLRKLGKILLSMSNYTIKEMSKIEGLRVPYFKASHFKEFTVNFGDLKVEEVNNKLLNQNIMGGKDLEREFFELGNTALYSITECHTKDQIDTLIDCISNLIEGEIR